MKAAALFAMASCAFLSSCDDKKAVSFACPASVEEAL